MRCCSPEAIVVHGQTRSLRRTAKCRLELLGLIFATIILPAGFGCAAPPNATPAPVDKPFAGAWQGFISYHGGRVDIRLNLTADKGGWRGTVFSPDWGDTDWPVRTVRFPSPDEIAVNVGNDEDREAELTGSRHGQDIRGVYRWDHESLPLVLSSGNTKLPRPPATPQVPPEPPPYQTERVQFKDKDVRLAGGLVLPHGAAPFPAVLILPGSSVRRWQPAVPGDPMPDLLCWVLSDTLARSGVATLRLDSRGVGGSGGNYQLSTFDELIEDAISAVEFLKARNDIEHARIGILGHSEGANIAAAAAARSLDVSFIIQLSGSAVPTEDLFLEQTKCLMTANHFDKNIRYPMGPIMLLNKKLYDLAKTDAGSDEIYTKMHGWYDEQDTKPMPREALDNYMARALTPLFRSKLRYDPGPDLRKLEIPILNLNGEIDLWCPGYQNVPKFRDVFQVARNSDATVITYPGLSHSLQKTRTGLSRTCDEVIDPKVLDEISAWTSKHVETKP
jgi:pimeloyl-ACP methyl ester carboxylesterase